MTMPTSSCPEPNLLRLYLRNQLPRAVAENIEQHILSCAYCTNQLSLALANTLPHSLHEPLRALSGANLDFSVDEPNDAERTQDIPPDAEATSAALAAYAANPFVRFQFLAALGEGGMGLVYRAEDRQLGRIVAFKMLNPTQVDLLGAQQRLHTEAVALARVQHPNIVALLESYPTSNPPFLALEYLPGGTLAERIATLQLPPDIAADILIPIAHALQAAHDKGVIHRDVKPANILFTGSRQRPLTECLPKLIDFSVAKFVPSDTPASGAIVGTPSYMSPEQARGHRDVGPATDIYGLGATLYELLCGRPPFRGTSLVEVCQLITEEEPISPRKLNRTVPRDLETICLRCLAKDPRGRYATAADLAADLQRYRRQEPIQARRVHPVHRGWKWIQRHRWLSAASTLFSVLLVAIVVSSFVLMKRWDDKRRDQDRLTNERMAADEIRQTHEYFAHLKQARTRALNPVPGWRWAGLADLEQAAAIATPARDAADMRTITANLLARTDVRVARIIAPNLNTWALAFCPTKNWLALGEGRGGNLPLKLQVVVCDQATGEVVVKLPYPENYRIKDGNLFQDRVRLLAFTPDGRWLVAGTRHGELYRWDTTTWQRSTTTVGFGLRSGCHDLAFTPDGSKLFVSVSDTQKGRLVRLDTRTWQQTGTRDLGTTNSHLAMRADGKALYCAEAHASVRELDPNDLAAERGTFAQDETGSLTIAPDGQLLATTRNGRLHLWETSSRSLTCVLREPHRDVAFPTAVNTLRFSPDQRLLAASDEFRRRVYLYDLVTRELVADWHSDGEGPHPIAFHPHEPWLLVGGQNGTTVLEIGGQREFRKILPQRHPLLAACLSPEGTHLAACYACPDHGKPYLDAALWQLPPNGPPQRLWEDNLGSGLAATVQTCAHGRTAIVAAGQVRVVDPKATPALVFSKPVKDADKASLGPEQRVWTNSGAEIHGLPLGVGQAPLRYSNNIDLLGTGLRHLTAFTLGKQHLLIGGLDGSVRLFPMPTPDAQRFPEVTKVVYPNHRNDVRALALAPDESHVLCGTEAGKVFLLRLPDLSTQAGWVAHEHAIRHAVYLSPRLLATGSADRTVRFWSRLPDMEPRLVWEQRLTGAITSLSATADGRYVCVTAEGERGIHLWDLQQLNENFRRLGIAFEP